MTARKVLSIILGVIIIIGGIYCICVPAAGIDFITVIAGIAIIVEGIGSINFWGEDRKRGQSSGWTLAGGIISIIIGTALIVGFFAKLAFATILIYFIVAWLILIGIVRIFAALKLRSWIKKREIVNPATSWKLMLAIGIIMILVGIIVFMNPIFIGWLIGFIIGIAFISAGCGLILIVISSK